MKPHHFPAAAARHFVGRPEKLPIAFLTADRLDHRGTYPFVWYRSPNAMTPLVDVGAVPVESGGHGAALAGAACREPA